MKVNLRLACCTSILFRTETRFMVDSIFVTRYFHESKTSRVSPRPRPHQCFIRMRWPPTPRDTLSGFAHKTVTVRRVMSLVSGSRVACWRERTCDQGSATWRTFSFLFRSRVLSDLILFDWSLRKSRVSSFSFSNFDWLINNYCSKIVSSRDTNSFPSSNFDVYLRRLFKKIED